MRDAPEFRYALNGADKLMAVDWMLSRQGVPP